MKIENIQEAEIEAYRFLKRLKALKKSQSRAFKSDSEYPRTEGSKETGALKRTSMDLSRSLSKLRNDTW